MKTLVNITPETLSPTMKMNLTVDGITVRSRITISLAEISTDVTQKTAKVVVVDESGSTTMRDYAMSNGQLIFPVEIDAAKALVFQMEDEDMMGIVAFSDTARIVHDLIRCDAAGKDSLVMALDRLRARNGGTDYISGLQGAYDMLRNVPAGYNRGIDFMSDGACNPGINPSALAEDIRNSGIMLCTAGIHDNMSGADEARLKEMSGGANFQACTQAEEVAKFLASALRKTKNAALTNVSLAFTAIGLVGEIKAFDMVKKNGNRNFVAGSVTAKSGNNPASATANIGELGPNDETEIYLEFSLKPPQFKEGIKFQKRTFGELMVMAACPTEGVTTPEETGKTEMFQNFAQQTSGTTNPEVEKLTAEWVAASAIAAAAKTTNAQQQQDILNQAAAKVRRATQVFTDDDSLAGALTDLETLQQQSRAQGAAAAGKSAGRKTAVFVDEE